MGVELRLCHSEYGLCICDEISGGHNQHAPTNITYEDNEERTSLLESLPPDDALSHSFYIA